MSNLSKVFSVIPGLTWNPAIYLDTKLNPVRVSFSDALRRPIDIRQLMYPDWIPDQVGDDARYSDALRRVIVISSEL